MKTNSIALIVLLCTISVATWFRQGAPEREPVAAIKLQFKRLSLYTSAHRIPCRHFGELELPIGTTFCLQLYDTHDRGAVGLMALDSSIGVISDQLEVNLTPSSWKSLTDKLSNLKGLRTEHCNDDTPQERVLYTRLEMDTNQGQFVSNWRGFPPEQKLVMETLLATPFGPDLRSRLMKLSDTKAPLTIPF